jgi:hypothetical protein
MTIMAKTFRRIFKGAAQTKGMCAESQRKKRAVALEIVRERMRAA